MGFVLLYHSTSATGRAPHLEIVPSHSSRLYARQLQHVKRWYRVVEAADVLDAVARRRRGDRFPVAITFDDDLPEHVEVALPVLQRLGLSATFFLCGAALDRPFSFWWERLQRAVDLDAARAIALVEARSDGRSSTDAAVSGLAQLVEDLEPAERAELARDLTSLAGADPEDAGLRAAGALALVQAGMTVGFHTLRHDPLDSLGDGALDAALRDGRERLGELAGRPLDVIAYPHGRTDGRVARASADAGFSTGFAADGLPVRPGDDPLLVPRITPSYRSAGHFAVQLVLHLLRDGRR
jgi:peptidoglycan/xylan/chitin deacetylase (PgdA/CDA1 family)